MDLLLYLLVFSASLLVDLVPFIGPPAWMVMLLLQVKFNLDIWTVLVIGVTGSALGRYLYSAYIPVLSGYLLKKQKNDDMQFIGKRLANNGWKVQLFVLLYTLVPLPSTPLFTAAGMARIRTYHIIPSFFIGKFASDSAMVLAGNYVATNVSTILHGLFSWQTLIGTLFAVLLICLFLFIDWKKLLQEKKFRFSFKIWK
jgi:membrane protein DedA with SNARE-associated domain